MEGHHQSQIIEIQAELTRSGFTWSSPTFLWGLLYRQGFLKEKPPETTWSTESHLWGWLEQQRTLLPVLHSPSSVTARSAAKAAVRQLNEARREPALEEGDR